MMKKIMYLLIIIPAITVAIQYAPNTYTPTELGLTTKPSHQPLWAGMLEALEKLEAVARCIQNDSLCTNEDRTQAEEMLRKIYATRRAIMYSIKFQTKEYQ